MTVDMNRGSVEPPVAFFDTAGEQFIPAPVEPQVGDLEGLGDRLVRFLIDDDESVDTLEQYVASVLVTKANLSFAPWSVGGARPFFVPSWVPEFERHSCVADGVAWRYEDAVFRGRGHVFLPTLPGTRLNVLFLSLSREKRGGKLQKAPGGDGRVLFRFTADRDAKAWRWAMVEAPRPRIVNPFALSADKSTLIIAPGGAR